MCFEEAIAVVIPFAFLYDPVVFLVSLSLWLIFDFSPFDIRIKKKLPISRTSLSPN
jgi:hypothetical protein